MEGASEEKRRARRTEFIVLSEASVHNGDMGTNEARSAVLYFNVLLDIERNTEQIAVALAQIRQDALDVTATERDRDGS